jgi:hypothetical protein
MLAVLLGLASSALTYWETGYDMKLLMWIDTWGETNGWYIRAGLVIVGAIAYILSARMEAAVDTETPTV